MFENILNTDYYKLLVHKFSKNVEFNSNLLPISNFNKLNLSFIEESLNKTEWFNLIIIIPKCFSILLNEIYSNLYLFMADKQFYENYSNPILDIHKKVIEKRGEKIYEIISINDGLYELKEIIKENNRNPRYPAILKNRSYQNVLNNFLIVRRKLNKNTIYNFIRLFCKLNNLDSNSDIIPTEFGSVSIFIGPKILWESFKEFSIEQSNLWNSIPGQYIGRDGTKTDTIGIAPLIYFTSSYQTAYQEVLQKQIKVSNIILLGAGYDEIQQMISDQFQHGFRIMGISTDTIENRIPQIKYWEWHKEEITLIESLC